MPTPRKHEKLEGLELHPNDAKFAGKFIVQVVLNSNASVEDKLMVSLYVAELVKLAKK